MADSDPISDDSVSSKRRKLNNGSNQHKPWDTDDDSGSDLFEEHETVPTQPVTMRRDYHEPQRPGDASQSMQPFTWPSQHQSTQVPRANGSGKSLTRQSRPQYDFSHSTQPTQLAYSQHETQNIQVARSSPGLNESPQPKPAPIRSALKPSRSTIVGSALMAPRGTTFRKPAVINDNSHRPTVINIDSDEDDPPVQHSSDEDAGPVSSFIKPTQFKKAGRGINSPEAPRPTDGQLSKFQAILSDFRHNENQSPHHDGIYLKPHKSVGIDRIEDVQDIKEQILIRRIQGTLGRGYPVSWCLQAIHYFGHDQQGCMRWLVDQNRKAAEAEASVDDLAPTPYKNAAKGVARSTQPAPITERSSTKQTVEATKTIAQKYGAAAAVRKQVVGLSQDEYDSDLKRKGRKLMRGRRRNSPSPEIDSGASSRSRVNRASKRTIGDDDDESTADEDQRGDHDVPKTFQQRLLQFFNTCTTQEMVDLSGQSLEFAEAIIAGRPFRSLAQVENVPHPTRPRANPVGLKMVEVCQDMMKGYDATAQLVQECEKLAQPIQAALKDWKLEKQENGELSIAQLDAEKTLGQPSNMSADVKLMAHQVVGLNWLHLLWTMRTSCILADDMGLGKTCQIISFLAQLQLDGVNGPHLVVVPASTLENWLREFARFAPSVAVLPYSGSVQEREEARDTIREAEVDVIITTYHYATSDHEFFRKEVAPIVCVYDEAHQLRNPKTKKYSQTMSISRKADFRVLLTGTPLQNNLKELVAILAFIMPELFRAKKDELELIFKHNANNMIEGHASLLSAQRIARARSMITPFILRRRKAQVISLPTKTRRVEYCDMHDSQVEAYEEVKQELLLQRSTGKKSAKMTNAIMDFRKISIHPLLMRRIYTDSVLDKLATKLQKIDYFQGTGDHAFIVRFLNGQYHAGLNGNDFSIHRFCLDVPELRKHALPDSDLMDSGKIDKLKELMVKYAANGDKVLLFSQFVIMLNILEPVMDKLGINYMRLDGSTDTNERQDLIDHFNNSPETTLFMLSTKAGGAGINLASANRVIIFDSGFNPQDDVQAENRAHRVGQTREVEVVRLITRGTVEEQIHALGESKLALDERVAGGAADDNDAEKANAKQVEQMLLEELDKKGTEETARPSNGNSNVGAEQPQDLKDAFTVELRKTGIMVG